jgi:hypothetical protein
MPPIEVVTYLPTMSAHVTEESCTMGDVYAPISHRFWRKARREADKLVPQAVNLDTVRT